MSEPYVIKMPQLSDTMTEGVIVSWEKNIGDPVARGDVVATVETDKAVMDVEVFRDGFLSGPIAPVDSVVPVTQAIAYLVDTADEPRSPPRQPVRLPPPPRVVPRYRVRRVSKPHRWHASWPASSMSISIASSDPAPVASLRPRIFNGHPLPMRWRFRARVVR
jgi:pyruvate/2-oxoglutarate dehydrogenase complex dihydrolipoamide acyltransferase (E2) component